VKLPAAAVQNGNGGGATARPTIACGTTAASALTGELSATRSMASWNAFWSGGNRQPSLEVLEQLTYRCSYPPLDELWKTLVGSARPCALGHPRLMCGGFIRRQDPQESPLRAAAHSEPLQNSWPPPEMFEWWASACSFHWPHPWRHDGSAICQPHEGRAFSRSQLAPSWPRWSNSPGCGPDGGIATTQVRILRDTCWASLATAGTNGQFRTPRHINRADGGDVRSPAHRRDGPIGLRPTWRLPVAVGEYLHCEHHSGDLIQAPPSSASIQPLACFMVLIFDSNDRASASNDIHASCTGL